MKLTTNKRLLIGLVSLLLAGLQLLTPAMVHASSASYQASDVIGQLDGSGNPSFTTRAIGTTASTLDYPAGSALDALHHRLFVNDCGNNRVLVFNLDDSNNLVSHTAAYVLGQADFTSAVNTTTQNNVSCPYLGLTADPTHNRLFVTDNGNSRIMVYDFSSGISNGMNASYELGQPGFSTYNSALTQNGLSQDVEDASYDATTNRLYVADTRNNRIVVYDLSGGITNGMNASYVLGQPDFITNTNHATQNGFYYPESVVINPLTQQLFVGDSRNYRVLVFNLSGGITSGMNASYVLGQPDFTTTGSTGTPSQNSTGEYVTGLGIDPTRNILYVSNDDYNRITVYNLAGGITNNMNASLVLGAPDFVTAPPYTCPTTAGAGELCDPEGSLSVDPANNRIYVVDSSDNRVLVYNFAKLSASLPAAALGFSYNTTLGSQIRGSASYSLSAGTLPAGLSLNATSGVLSGTPTKAGSYSFTISLIDTNGTVGSFTDSRAYSLVVPAAPSAPAAPATGYTVNQKTSHLPILAALLGAIALIAGARWYASRR